MKSFIYKNRKVLVFSSVALIFLLGIGAIQLLVQQSKSFEDVPVVKTDEEKQKEIQDKEAETNASVEILKKPVADDVEVARYFYDPSYDDAKLEDAMVYFEGVYRPNMGMDFSKKGESFEVTAALSGKVTKKTNDPLLGWVVTITSDNNVSTTYQSLKEVTVEKDAEVKQGDVLGTAGENVYESDLKTHLHFVLEKDNTAFNPETYYDKEITAIGQ